MTDTGHGDWPGPVEQWRLINDGDQPGVPCASCGEPPEVIVFFEQPAEVSQPSVRWCFACLSTHWADKLSHANHASENGDPPFGTAGNMAHFWQVLAATRQSYEEILRRSEGEDWHPNGLRKPMERLEQAAKHYKGGNSGPDLKWGHRGQASGGRSRAVPGDRFRAFGSSIAITTA